MENSGKRSDLKWIIVVLVVLALIAAWLLFKEDVVSGGGASDRKTSVMLICLDGVRLDRLGCMGFEPDVTPALNRLVQSGALFTQCTTPAPDMMTAWASVMTGKYPFNHGIRYSAGQPNPLGDAHETLAEILSAKGYPTAARVANPILCREFKLDAGIWPQDFTDPLQEKAIRQPPGQPQQQAGARKAVTFEAQAVAKLASEWLRNNGDRSFFLWVNMVDAAAPFFPPEPYASQHTTAPYVGDLAFVDSQLAVILDAVDDMRESDRPLIVLASSFGEGLGDHIEPYHSWFLYDSTTRVPLVFSMPGRIAPGTRIDAQVSLIDTLPTVLDLVGVEAPRSVQGRSLVPLLDGAADDLGIAAYSEAIAPMVHLEYYFARSLRKDGWKYILAPTPELYNLQADPGEQNNVAGENGERVNQMRAELFALVTGSPQPPELDLTDPKVFSNPDGGINEAAYMLLQAEDPKNHAREIQLYESANVLRAVQMFDDALANLKELVQLEPSLTRPIMNLIDLMQMMPERSAELVPYLQEFLAANPDRDEVRFRLADILQRQNDVKGALEQMQILEASLGTDNWEVGLDLRMADLFRANGQYEEAEKRYLKAVESDPGNMQFRLALARLYADSGAFDKLTAMVREMGGGAGPDGAELSDFQILLNMGKTMFNQRSFDAAASIVRKTVELDPESEDARQTLGAILGRKGDYEGCIDVLKGMLEKWPGNENAAHNLALAYKQSDRPQDAIDVLNKMLEGNPDQIQALTMLAMIRAASPHEEVRSGDEALKLAQKACELTQNQDPLPLHALAAAYAEQGKFDEAIEADMKAFNLAVAAGKNVMARGFQGVVTQFYRKQQPFREPVPGAEPAAGAPEGKAPETPAGETPEAPDNNQ